MCNKYEARGKTVDEAIFRGLNDLEISIDEVDVEVVQTETKGVFGIGAKPAIVILTKREMPREFDVAAAVRTERPERHETRRDHQRNDKGRVQRSEKFDRYEKRIDRNTELDARDVTDIKLPDTDMGYRDEQEVSADTYHNQEQRYYDRPRRSHYQNGEGYQKNRAYNSNIPEYTEEAVKDSVAAQFVAELMERMGIEAEVTAAIADNEQRINIASEESAALLIGKRGETLDAIQYLTALIVNRADEERQHIKVAVDVDGYRQRRYEKLVRTARAKANMVKSTGRDYSFEPMTPFDRRIIHYALQRNPYVTTHSEGEEPNRFVIITPKRRHRSNRY